MREHRRRRMRRRRRRAYIRSVYFLPSMATLGNAVCGFGAMYVSALDPNANFTDRVTRHFATHQYSDAAYLIFVAMIFDALDGRLARFTRHTTDFGGQLDSLADVVSFGAAPAFVALQVFKNEGPEAMPFAFTRLIWAIGALYFSCAMIRLARFNVSNEHGEQHHFSFLGLPSPGAAGAVVGWILVQQDLRLEEYNWLAFHCVMLLPLIVLFTGLLMVSNLRYPHLVNRYLRGRRSVARLILAVGLLLLFMVAHRYVICAGALAFAAWGPLSWAMLRLRPTHTEPAPLPHSATSR
jgi:CDP-diacylglycerol--serine O-phosphatidyltransferase